MNAHACPHCGGLNGYCTTQRRKVTRHYDWGGVAQDLDDTEVLSETKPRCFDCKKLVTTDVADDSAEGLR